MTLARFFATGSGTVEARLMIEGLAVEFVSDPGMVLTTADGRRRVHCLPSMGKGIVIEDTVNIPEAKLEAQGTPVRLFETQDEDLAQVFAWRPDAELWITTTVAVADTTVLLLDVGDVAVDDVVHIGTEAMLVTNVGAGVLTVTRAHWDTIAQKHWSNDGDRIPYRILTNRPLSVRGRRAYLYLYGDGDDLTGNGTQVWLGTVSRNPKLGEAGEAWLLTIDSIAARLDSKLGGELDVPMVPRGAYYSWAAPLFISLQENGGAWTSPRYFTGWYATQRSFVVALTTTLETIASEESLASTYRAIELEDGRWTVEVVAGVSVTSVAVALASLQDGETALDFNFTRDAAGEFVGTLSSGDVVYPSWVNDGGHSDARLVPRGVFAFPPAFYSTAERSVPTDRATFPERRLYLDKPVSTDWSALIIEWADGVSYDYTITTTDATSNYVETAREDAHHSGANPHHRYGAWSMPTIRPFRTLASGNLADLRDAIVAEGPLFANRGTAPFLTTADLADWTTVVEEAIGPSGSARAPWLGERIWNLTSPVEVLEVLSAEMQLAGVFPIIDSDGKIGVARLDVPNAATAGAITLDDELITVRWSDMDRGDQTVNRVVYSLGYDAKEDEWTRTIDPVDMTSFAQDHTDRPLEVKPRSRANAEQLITAEDAAQVALPTLALFGYPHDFVTVAVPWTYFQTAILGATVSFSADHLPDFTTGTRGIGGALGIVVGRKWELGEAHGELRILIPWQNVAGYSPTARIASQVDNGGNKWDVTVTASMYAPSGSNDDTFFAALDVIRIVEYDSESPTIVTGTITAINTTTHVISVDLDGVWTPGSSTWELVYDNHANVVADQKIYAFFADSGARLGTSNARLFAP